MADTNSNAADRNIGDSEYKIHTKKYTDLLDNYIIHIKDSNRIKNAYKHQFFWIIIGIMIALTVLFGVSVIKTFYFADQLVKVENRERISKSGNDYGTSESYESPLESIVGVIVAVVSSFVTMLVSLFKLPKIIAKYLFNPKEDESMAKIIGQIQKYDTDMYAIEKQIERKMMKQEEEKQNISERDSVKTTDSEIGNPDNMSDESNSVSESA